LTGARVLVAGVGNAFLGDDGFGPEVARRLSSRPLPDGVQVVDFGIRAIDLAYALLDGYDLIVLIDAAPRGDAPGTLTLLEPDLAGEPTDIPMAGHSLVPHQVLAMVRSMAPGRDLGAFRVVGCEPASVPEEPEIQVGLSRAVEAAVDRAVDMVERLVEGWRREA